MMQINGDTLHGEAREVIQALIPLDLTSAMISILMCSWEEEHNDEKGEAGWNYGPGLFMMFRCYPDDEEAEQLAQREALGQGMAMHALPLPDLVQTEKGPSLELFIHRLALALRREQDKARILLKSPEEGWDFCAFMAVLEAYIDGDRTREARLAVTVDRAKYRYCLVRERGQDDNQRQLIVRLTEDPNGDDMDDITNALGELVEVVPEESMT
jgi:hypothetical protein